MNQKKKIKKDYGARNWKESKEKKYFMAWKVLENSNADRGQ